MGTDAGGEQGLGLVSGGGRLHGSLGYSGLFLLVVSLALIGPTYKIEASHWLREAKGACFVLPHLLHTTFFSLNQLVQFVFESSGVMAVAHLAWPCLDFERRCLLVSYQRASWQQEQCPFSRPDPVD